MRNRAFLCTLLLSFASGTALPQAATQETLTLKAERRIVVIDVVVTDNKGNPIHGLKPSDFQVTEQNQPQLIEHLDEEDSSHAATTAVESIKMPPGVFTNIVSAPTSGPLNILLFDTANTPAENQLILREQVKSFIKALKPGARVAIFGLGAHLYLMQGFTSDPTILQKALFGKKDFTRADAPHISGGRNDRGSTLSDNLDPGSSDPAAAEAFYGARKFEAQTALLEQETAARATLGGLNQLARFLAGLPGRKNLIWFSAAFPTYILPTTARPDSAEMIPGGPTLSTTNVDYLYETIGLLSRAQVAVYPIDPRGVSVDSVYTAQTANSVSLRSRPDYYSTRSSDIHQQTQMEHLTMTQLADSTGGKAYFNTNDLTGAAEKAFAAGANYYTITYTPTNNDWRGEYRTIKIHSPVEGVHLAYRNGYYATHSGTHGKFETLAAQKAKTETTALTNALTRGTPPATEITLNVRVTLGTAGEPPAAAPDSRKHQPWKHYILDYAADASSVTFEPGEGTSRTGAVEFICMIYDADGKILNVGRTSAKLNLNPKQYAAALVGGLRAEQDITAPPNSYFRIAVHDKSSNRIGAIEVPSASIPSSNATNIPVATVPKS
jgi:VWFA-related protein